jgi:hypothetical protein
MCHVSLFLSSLTARLIVLTETGVKSGARRTCSANREMVISFGSPILPRVNPIENVEIHIATVNARIQEVAAKSGFLTLFQEVAAP